MKDRRLAVLDEVGLLRVELAVGWREQPGAVPRRPDPAPAVRDPVDEHDPTGVDPEHEVAAADAIVVALAVLPHHVLAGAGDDSRRPVSGVEIRDLVPVGA